MNRRISIRSGPAGWSLLAGCLALLLIGLTLTPAPMDAQEDGLRVAFVYDGTPGGDAWTQQHDLGRQYMERELGDQLAEVTVVEDVPVVDSTPVFEQLASEGYDIIFGTTFGFQETMMDVSPQYPDTAFMNAAGFMMGDNQGNFFIRTYQTSFLSGVIAGHHVDDGPVGYVAPHPIPSTLRQINSFTYGLRTVKPDVQVRLVWTDAFHDPAAEREAAQSLIDAGAELIAQYTDSPAPVQTAEDRGVPSIGFYSDLSQYGPNTHLTSPVMNWGPFYVDEVQRVMNGNWEPRSYWEGMDRGLTMLSPYTDNVNAEAARAASKYRYRILAGQREVFEGPIEDNNGNLIVEEGENLSDGAMYEMDWLIEGVSGSLPE